LVECNMENLSDITNGNGDKLNNFQLNAEYVDYSGRMEGVEKFRISITNLGTVLIESNQDKLSQVVVRYDGKVVPASSMKKSFPVHFSHFRENLLKCNQMEEIKSKYQINFVGILASLQIIPDDVRSYCEKDFVVLQHPELQRFGTTFFLRIFNTLLFNSDKYLYRCAEHSSSKLF